jgi:hypothetical protein
MRRQPPSLHRLAVGWVVLGAVAAGCGLGDRQRYADTLGDAPRIAARSGAAQVTVSVAVSWASAPGTTAPARSASVKPFTLVGWVDFAKQQGELGSNAKPFLKFRGLTWYALRPDALPDEARPWVTFRADQIEKHARAVDPAQITPAVGALAIPTTFFVDLVGGSLAGSLSQQNAPGANPREQFRGFTGNFDIDKALKGTPAGEHSFREREQLLTWLGFLGVSEEPHRGQVTIDREGRPVRFSVELLEKPRRATKIHLKLDVQLDRYGQHQLSALPGDDETVELGSGNEFLEVLAAHITTLRPRTRS